MTDQDNRIRIGHKIALIGGSFLLPITVLVYLMVNSMNGAIEFADKELRGAAFLRPAMALQSSIMEYRNAIVSCGGGAVDCPQLAEAKGGAASALTQLEQQQALHGTVLQFTPDGLGKRGRVGTDAAGLQAQWKQLVSLDPKGNPTEWNKKYETLASTLRSVITHAGDTSNLILDPDLDSYYLMDVVLLAAPQMQDRLARISRQASASADSNTGRTQLQVLGSLLEEADSDRLAASNRTAINEDANFYGVSATLRPRLEASIAPVMVSAKQLITDIREGKASPEDIMKAAGETRRLTLAYWNVANEELSKLLQARIESYRADRTRALVISSISVLAASLLAFFLLQSITSPLEKLVRSLGPGATLLTGCVDRISQVSTAARPDPEEASIICGELNAHADEMRKAVLELARQVAGADAENMTSSAAGIRA